MGTNRVKYTIAEINICQKKFVKQIFKKSWHIPQDAYLFKDYDGTVSLSHDSKDKTLAAFEQIKATQKDYNFDDLKVIATGVFREVTNPAPFFERINKIIGQTPRVLTSLEEAQAGHNSFLVAEDPATLPANFLLWDIGGNSMQLTLKMDGKIKYVLGGRGSQFFKQLAINYLKKKSTPNPIGINNLDKIRAEFRRASQDNLVKLPQLPENLTVFGMGAVHSKSIMDQMNDFNQTDNKSYTLDDLKALIIDMANLGDAELGGEYAANKVTNALMVEDVMKYLKIKNVQVRDLDLTYGVLVYGLKEKK
jgi:exopolyphosphatase/pppGpp-phosphohydrolase